MRAVAGLLDAAEERDRLRERVRDLLRAAEVREETIDRLRKQITAAWALIPPDPELIEAGYGVRADDLRAALDTSTIPQPIPGRCTCGAGAACSDGSL